MSGGIGGAVGGFIEGGGGRFAPDRETRAAIANSGVQDTSEGSPTVVSNGRIVTTAQAIPGLPDVKIDFPGTGDQGFEFSVGGVGFSGFQESQEVRTQAAGLPMLGPMGVMPAQVQRVTRVCPTGHRLAKDGLCYPKALLAKRSKLRMWPAEPAPPITRADGRALRGHERVEKKLKVLGKRAGLKVTG